jgi:hypothetical protein
MSLSCPCVGGSCAERAGNLVLVFVVRPLGRETISSIPRLNEGQPPSDRGDYGSEGDHHPGSDLHPEVIAG